MGDSKRKKLSTLAKVFGRDKRTVPMPQEFRQSECFKSLSFSAQALYGHLCDQYRLPTGKSKGNNGDLTLSFSYMSEHHYWRSSATLNKAKKELLERGILLEARKQKGRYDTVLYALSTHAIDFCDDGYGNSKHDLKPGNKPPDDWRNWKPPTA